MKAVEKKKHGILFGTVWYADEKYGKNGIFRYRSALKPFGKENAEFRTLVSDLKLEEEQIVAKYSKNCRYEIRRAAKEGVTCSCRIGSQLSDEEIDRFAAFFEKFWQSKGVDDHNQSKYAEEIREYASAEAFAISTASLGDRILVYHTYIVGDNFVRLYQSASHFRTEDEVPYSLIGMANRYLHKEDMLFFKEKGFSIYDWGGAGTGEEVASITKFKESFGGDAVTYYEFEEAVGCRAKCFKALLSLISRF